MNAHGFENLHVTKNL